MADLLLRWLDCADAMVSGSKHRTTLHWHAFRQFLAQIKRVVLRALHNIAQAASAVKRAILWIAHVPGRIITAIDNFCHALVRWFLAALHLGLLLAKFSILACALLLVAYWLFRFARYILAVRTRWLLAAEASEREILWRQEDAVRAARFQREREREVRERQERVRLERARKEREAKTREEEARRRREQAEQAERRRRAAEGFRRLELRRKYERWRAECDGVLNHAAETRRISEPPSWLCGHAGCGSEQRGLKACRHNLEDLFRSTEKVKETLREEQRRWSPNRLCFAVLEKAGSAGASAVANEICAVVNGLLDSYSTNYGDKGRH